MTGDESWRSRWAPTFDQLVSLSPPPAVGVAQMIEFEDGQGLVVPEIYVSTAITSAGHKRDPAVADDIGEVIRRNNRTGALLMAALEQHQGDVVSATNVMVPTELGKVKGWGDTAYLQFYFAWLAGLSAQGAGLFVESLSDPVYAGILGAADDRTKANAERWPSYRIFTEVAIAKLAEIEGRRGAKRSDGSQLLLQLNDVEESLGCRAERLFADARGLDILAPTVDVSLDDDLGRDVRHLQSLGAQVGVPRMPVDLAPVQLR